MRFYRDRAAVVLREKPSQIARKLYGTAHGACRALGLDLRSFHRWDRSNRIPYSVYQRMLGVNSEIQQYVRTFERVNARPFKVPYDLKPGEPVRMGKAVPRTPTKRSETNASRLVESVSALERENAKLRQALSAIRQVIAESNK